VKVFASILVENILPVFLAAGLGYLLDRKFRLDVKTISRVSFYVLAPSLIFTSLTKSSVSGAEFSRIVLFLLLVTAIMLAISLGWSRFRRFSRAEESAFLLSVLFINAGNYGLSVNLFAFGEAALARALLFFAGSTVLMNTLGVFLASRGRANLKTALLNVFKVPMVYGVALAFVARSLPWSVARMSWFRGLETLGRRVRVQFGETVEEGVAEDASADGSIILRRDDGSRVRIEAGDVTLNT
jgi:hypothetical protein